MMTDQPRPSPKSGDVSPSSTNQSIWTRQFDLSWLDIWFGGLGLVASPILLLTLGERGYETVAKLALASAALLLYALYRRHGSKS